MNLNRIKTATLLIFSTIALNIGYYSLKNNEIATLSSEMQYSEQDEYYVHEDSAQNEVSLEESQKLLLSEELLALDSENSEESSAEKKPENIEYTIKYGDTISEIAKKYNTKIEYLFANNLDIDLKTLKIGKQILIPTENGIFYKIDKEDSFSALEKKFNISQDIIKSDNDISQLNYGNTVFLREPKIAEDFKNKIATFSKKTTSSNSSFKSPLSSLVVTSSYGTRNHPVVKKVIAHGGVDLKAPTGSKVMAAQGGVVKFAGYSGNYGYLVVITHPNGYESRYAHLSKINVKKGQRVNSRETIALSGATGRVTGPHLHFEIRKNGKALNPLTYVKS
ncbi:MAG: peptidoglycan DD-metalloendopeptidase family protein [Fusobacteriaceae bacterium]